jgi:hypothetical protein
MANPLTLVIPLKEGDRELLPAKVCARWRTGVLLVLSPDTGTPEPPLPPERINDFDYVSSWSNRRLTGFGPSVTTRGGAYCYLQSITALRVLSA